MSRFVQPLEQRRLLSVSPSAAVSSSTLTNDLTHIRSDATAVRTAASAVRATLQADLRTLRADVHALKVTSNNALLATLNHDNAVGQVTTGIARAGLLGNGVLLSAVVIAQGKLLLLRPTNSTLRARLSMNTTNLNSTVGSKGATLQSAITSWKTTLNTDLGSIASANPSSTTIAADVSKTEADIAAGVTSYANAINSFKASIPTLITDLDAIPT